MTGKSGKNALILACSPRRGGNSDTAAETIRRETSEDFARVEHLRDYAVLPCVSCGLCAQTPNTPCPLRVKDDSRNLFAAIEAAKSVTIVCPVYFYHLPAQLKALVDRSQPWWAAREADGKTPDKRGAAYAVLIGARRSGAKLFEGSILTLRLWLRLFGFELADPLTLYGLDAPAALAGDQAALDALCRYAKTMRRA